MRNVLMKTACEIVGRIDARGKFVFDGKVPIRPGPAKAKIVALPKPRRGKAASKKTPAKAKASDVEYRHHLHRRVPRACGAP